MSTYLQERKGYRITSGYKKATYQTEQWTNVLENGKTVTLHVTTLFRSGNFEIRLTDGEKKDILETSDMITLNDYDHSLERLWDGCDLCVEIIAKDSYEDMELKEIHGLMYTEDYLNSTSSYNDKYNSDNDYNSDNEYSEDIMESNGWQLVDTIYKIAKGCRLEALE